MDWAEATSTTGGTGTLTLTGVSGSPGFGDYPGAPAVRFVQYAIDEFTDAGRGTLSKSECGIGTFTTSGATLARTKVLATWNGTTYVTASPTALTFGSTAANIRVSCGPLADVGPGVMPWMVTAVGDNIGVTSLGAYVTTGTYTGVIDQECYVPFWWAGTPDVNQAAIVVTTSTTTSGIKAGVYEVGSDGLPGRLLKDLTGGTPFVVTSTGNKTGAVSGLVLPPGWYYACLLFQKATVLRATAQVWSNPAGSSTGLTTCCLTGTGSYSTGLPATRSITPVANTTSAPCLYLRARN